MSDEPVGHICNEAWCTCPIHGTPLVYWPAGKDHACQDIACKYGHGGCDPGSVQAGQERYLSTLLFALAEDVRRGWNAGPITPPSSTAYGMYQTLPSAWPKS